MAEQSRTANNITSLTRGLSILKAIGNQQTPQRHSDLVAATGLPKATIARLTHTLSVLGYIQQNEVTARYQPGHNVSLLTSAFINALPILRVAPSLMQEFSRKHHISVALGMRVDDQITFLRHYSKNGDLTIKGKDPNSAPLSHTVAGQAWFCGQTPLMRKQLLAELEEFGLLETKLLQSSLTSFEEVGFCSSFGEWKAEDQSVAVPLQLEPNAPILVLEARTKRREVAESVLTKKIGPDLIKLSAEISAGMDKIGISFWDE